MKQRGKLYGISVVPGKQAEDSVAYRIAAGICENLTEKQLIAVEMPMVKDDVVLEAGHRAAAEQIEALLEDGDKRIRVLTESGEEPLEVEDE